MNEGYSEAKRYWHFVTKAAWAILPQWEREDTRLIVTDASLLKTTAQHLVLIALSLIQTVLKILTSLNLAVRSHASLSP